MKAAVYRGPNKIVVEDVPTPEISPEEYLMKVEVCGLCKTDVKKIRGVSLPTKGVLKPPRVFGHEIVGSIKKIGDELYSSKNFPFKEGDKVAIYHHVPCLECYPCKRGDYAQCDTYRRIDTTAGIGEPSGGGFAQYVKVPKLVAERGTVKIPDNVTYKEAAFMEPTNCCLKAMNKANIQAGDYVAVLGQGPIGLTLDQLAKLKGAEVIALDLVDYRLEKASKLGTLSADYTINAHKEDFVTKVKNLTEGRGVDVSIIAVESPKAVKESFKMTRGGGTVVFFSESGQITPSTTFQELPDIIYGKELTIKGCYSSSFKDHQYAMDLIADRIINVEGLISHRAKLNALMGAVDLADKRRHYGWEGTRLSYRPRKSFKILVMPFL